ncbi:phage holin family protein [Streptomyces coeruleorubidus]|uniref:phage holin family protein n=1 Tax=Streptomyces coeruleorubidus TaxID=116188 RepID=UPI00379610B3
MKPLDHLEHLDKHLVDELAQVARETVRDELREQTRKQRRKAALYAASGALALYAGAALALAVGLALALGLPDWAAALITAAILGVAAYVLRGMARPSASPPGPAHAAAMTPGHESTTAPGTGVPGGVPPVPPAPPVAGPVAGAAGGPAPGVVPPRPADDPDVPPRRA